MKFPFNIGSRPIQGNFDFLMKLLGSNRIVRSIVLVSGAGASVVEGTGYSVSRNALGDGTITFSPPFSDRPSVSCTPIVIDRAMCEHASSPGTGAAYRAQGFIASTGAAAEVSFHFIAIGP